ncbi:hypothetical protein H4R18_000569 [Coemansia javaensis]|uniref:F-box domain-containing protein n=1 Tax=Coemansia javaensis TaxID=2761396 RepID=A0A9W8LKE6_9FUNG|nr:hypothetical protein H4R18_000569 [Coemansia javaensis]
MYLRDLPDDILRLVFKFALERHDSTAVAFRANRQLLTVCRRWRYLALPAVHSGLVVRYGCSPDGRCGSEYCRINTADGGPHAAEAATNLGLIVAAGCVRTVSSVEIAVYCAASLFPGLDAVLRLMHTAAGVWRGARRLEISIYPDSRMFDEDGPDAADYGDQIEKASAMLFSTMPGVRRVLFGGAEINPVAWEFCGRLAALYSNQLQDVYSLYPIVVPPECTFRQLRDTCIYYRDGAGYQHPRVVSTKLVSLGLLGWPSNHSWAPFSAGGDTKVIEFLNLKELDVVYFDTAATSSIDVRHRDGHPWKIRFPKLERANIFCLQNICPLLEYAVFPRRIEKLDIRATASMFLQMSEMLLPAARRLKIGIASGANGNPAVLAAANRILDSAQGSETVCLDVDDKSLPVFPSSITCAPLTELLIRADTGVDTVLQLIQEVPGLTSLKIHSLALSDTHTDLLVPGLHEAHLVAPLNTSVRKLRIFAKYEELELGLIVPLVKYLLLRIPELIKVTLREDPNGSLAQFVWAYAARYPHLKDILFTFQEDNGRSP